MGLTSVIYFIAAGMISAGPVYELDPTSGIHEVSAMGFYWEDPSVLTIDEVVLPENQKRFESFSSLAENFGFNDYAIWVRVNLKNSLDRRAKWILEIADPLIDLFEIHIPDAFGRYAMKSGGDTLPFAHREIKYERFAFELQFEPGETKSIFVLFRPGYSSCKLTAYKPKVLTESVHREQLFAGIFFGMLFLAIVYNFFIFASMRHTAFLDYVAYGFALMGAMAVIDGYCAQYFLPNFPVLSNRLIGVFAAFGGLSVGRFIISYIGPESLSFGLIRYVRFMIWANGFAVLIALLSPSVIGVPVAVLAMLLTPLAVVWTSVLLASRSHPETLNFVIAWSSMALGVTITGLAHLGVINLNVPPILPVKIASALNLILLSLGLAAHFGRIQRENAIQSEVLVKQEKLVQIGEMMGELSHEIKNLNNASILGMAVEQDRVGEILSFFAHTDSRWPDLGPVLFEPRVAGGIVSQRLERWQNIELEHQGTAGIFDELREFMAGLAADDSLLDTLMDKLARFELAQMVLLNHIIALSRRLLMMNTTAGHANGLLGSVLNYSRESQDILICDLAMVVESCHRLIAKKLELRNISYQFHCSGPVLAAACSSELHQVVLNLLGNAYDALEESPHAEKSLTVYLGQAEEGMLTLQVENNGPAIPLRVAERIFERNFSTKGAKGSGIGLFVCRKLLRKNGGDIRVDSSGLKTVFTLKLPVPA